MESHSNALEQLSRAALPHAIWLFKFGIRAWLFFTLFFHPLFLVFDAFNKNPNPHLWTGTMLVTLLFNFPFLLCTAYLLPTVKSVLAPLFLMIISGIWFAKASVMILHQHSEVLNQSLLLAITLFIASLISTKYLKVKALTQSANPKILEVELGLR